MPVYEIPYLTWESVLAVAPNFLTYAEHGQRGGLIVTSKQRGPNNQEGRNYVGYTPKG